MCYKLLNKNLFKSNQLIYQYNKHSYIFFLKQLSSYEEVNVLKKYQEVNVLKQF